MSSKERFFISPIILLIIFNLYGCVTVKYQKPISTFQNNINKTGRLIGDFLTETNKFERELYLEERLYDNSLDILWRIGDQPTPLQGKVLNHDSIKARVKLFNLLGIYAKTLGRIAGKKTTTRFKSNVDLLGKDLINLSENFNGLGDPNAKKYVNPVTKIIKVLGEMIIEKKRAMILTKIINESAPAVNEAIDLIAKDVEENINHLAAVRRAGIMQILSSKVTYYNENRGKLDFTERRMIIDEIKGTLNKLDAFVLFNPMKLVKSLKNSHNALVKYAKSDKKPKDLDSFLTELESFKSRVNQFSEAIKQLKE
jgi:hypothetical protein